MKPPVPRFTEADMERAHQEWGANCGPGAIAAILHRTLDEVRPHLGDFESKGYTNPTLMIDSLNRLGARWRTDGGDDPAWPDWGLVRIQWTGRWTQPRVPPRVAYRYTHWVGACRHVPESGPAEIGVFDVNCLNNGNGWVGLADWESLLVPSLVEGMKGADGGWCKTHVIEVERPAP